MGINSSRTGTPIRPMSMSSRTDSGRLTVGLLGLIVLAGACGRETVATSAPESSASNQDVTTQTWSTLERPSVTSVADDQTSQPSSPVTVVSAPQPSETEELPQRGTDPRFDGSLAEYVQSSLGTAYQTYYWDGADPLTLKDLSMLPLPTKGFVASAKQALAGAVTLLDVVYVSSSDSSGGAHAILVGEISRTEAGLNPPAATIVQALAVEVPEGMALSLATDHCVQNGVVVDSVFGLMKREALLAESGQFELTRQAWELRQTDEGGIDLIEIEPTGITCGS